MTTSIPQETTETAAAPATKARARKRSAKAATAKAKPARKAARGKKPVAPAQPGSKAAKVLDLLKRPGGVTLKELVKATSWQAHSVRGFLSTVGKKMGTPVESFKSGEGERSYRLASK